MCSTVHINSWKYWKDWFKHIPFSMRTSPLYSFVPRKSQNAKLLFPASQNFPTGLNTRTVYTQLNFNLYSNSIPLETLITCSITRKHRFTFERGCCYSIGPLPYSAFILLCCRGDAIFDVHAAETKRIRFKLIPKQGCKEIWVQQREKGFLLLIYIIIL